MHFCIELGRLRPVAPWDAVIRLMLGRLYACSREEPTVARTNREIAVRPAVVVGIWHRDPASPASEL